MKRFFSALLMLLLLLSSFPASAASPEDKTATILFTHDLHSSLLPKHGQGGYARLKTVIEQQRQVATTQETACVTLDGGDFSMGTLFQTLFTTEAPDLYMLGALGIDATTLGNHEFDYGGSGLADMLQTSAKSSEPLPALVVANYRPLQKGEDGYSDAAKAMESALDEYGAKNYIMLEREGIRFAVFGLMGENSHSFISNQSMHFEPMAEAARKTIKEIQNNEDYDFIVCLSHAGTSELELNAKSLQKAEDVMLAKEVDGIDFIVSGHTHSILETPLIINNTIIGSSGAFGVGLGSLTLHKDVNGKNTVLDYKIIPIDETPQEHTSTADMVQRYKDIVEQKYLARFNLKYDQVVAHSPFSFVSMPDIGQQLREEDFGNLITDAYRYAAAQVLQEQDSPIDVAIVNVGVIRDTFTKGDITVADVFGVSALGSGADGTPGNPLITVWLTGKELRDLMEVDISVSPILPVAQLYMSGVSYKFNEKRLPLNRTYDAMLMNPDQTMSHLADEKLYHIVTNLYSGRFFGMVEKSSFGILSAIAKDESGVPISDLETRILKIPDGYELKEWLAMNAYLSSFPKQNGVSLVPDSYAIPQGRKIAVDTLNPIELLRQPRWTTMLLLALAALLIVAVVFVVRIIMNRSVRTANNRSRSN